MLPACLLACVVGAAGAVAVDIAHKTVVLQCVQKMCENGQLLVDLFVNYDCDLEGANLFERMVRPSEGSGKEEEWFSGKQGVKSRQSQQGLGIQAFMKSITLWGEAYLS